MECKHKCFKWYIHLPCIWNPLVLHVNKMITWIISTWYPFYPCNPYHNTRKFRASPRHFSCGTPRRGTSRQNKWNSLLHTSQSSISAGSLLDPNIWQCNVFVCMNFPGYIPRSDTGTELWANYETWRVNVAPSRPCKTTTLDSLSSVIRKICGVTGGCKVLAFDCFSKTYSPSTNLALGLSYPPPLTRRNLFLSRCWVMAIFLVASGITCCKTAPRWANSHWNFLCLFGSMSNPSSSKCRIGEENDGCLPYRKK